MKKKLLLLLLLFGYFKSNAQCTDIPVINSFSPQTTFIGDVVTIKGANFDSQNKDNNVVYFGATKAEVISASFGTLKVYVPVGASTAPISVTNSCNLTAVSEATFNGIFCPTEPDNTTYANNVLALSVNAGAYNMVSADLNLDGLPEVISGGFGSNISIAVNTSTGQSLSFDKLELTTTSTIRSIVAADLDGDGWKDLITTTQVFLNTTSSNNGVLSFASPFTFPTVSDYQITVGDVNGDGKLDLLGERSRNFMVALNTSTPGSLSFGEAQTIQSTIGDVTGANAADIDGDGKVDFFGSQYGDDRAVSLRNTTPKGSDTVTFESAEYWVSHSASGYTSSRPYRSLMADFDRDGKMDFVGGNYTGGSMAVWRNNSEVGDIEFDTVKNFQAPNSNYRIGVGDLDGDGYPDLVSRSSGSRLFSIYINNSSQGSISFESRIDYNDSYPSGEITGIVVGDIDGDYIPDIAISGTSSRTIRFYPNQSVGNDDTPPNAVAKDIIVGLGTDGTVTITPDMIDNGSSDACGLDTLVLDKTQFTCNDVGDNTVTLTVTDRAGNVSTATSTVTIKQAAIITQGQSTVCAGETVQLTANEGGSYQWFKNQVAIDGATSQSYTVTTTGNYSVEVINSGGCSGTSLETEITINENPTIDVLPNGTAYLCSGNIELKAAESSLYQWVKDGVNIPDATLQTYKPSSPGNYQVIVTDSFGCSATSDEIIVSNDTAPEVEVVYESSNFVSGTSKSLGTISPNTSSSHTYTISNTGVNTLRVSGVNFSGTGSGFLNIPNSTFPIDIAQGESTDITLNILPTTAGSYESIMQLVTNDCDEQYIEAKFTYEVPDVSDLTSETITVASISDLVYTGLGQTPSPEVKDGTTVLVQDTDYTVSYQDNINVGEATVTITGINAYEGSRTTTFSITPAPLTIAAEDKSKVFGESDPDLTVSYAGFVNGEDKDDLTGTLLINRVSGEAVSTYAITASGLTSTNYDITYTPGTFTITSRLITQSAFMVSPITDLVYTGLAQTPSQLVKDGATTLVEDTDYELSYAANTNVGTATVTITGKGNYNGTRTVTFNITPAPLTITAEDKSKVFGESDPDLTVSYTGFVNGEDQNDLSGTLSISRTSGETPATYTITASGLTSTNYVITYETGEFTIGSKSITDTDIRVASISDLVYTGLAQTPSQLVKDGATTLVEDTDYELSYAANTNVGTATVTITGKGNYNGTRRVTFNILKKTLTISGLTADDKEYDGTTEATLSGTAILLGIVDGDDVILSGIPESTFTSPNVSTGVTVTVVGYELTGTAKDNYSLSQPTGLSADITYRVISVTPTSGLTKLYGESDPEFTYTFGGTVSGQKAAFSGSLSRIQGENVDSYQFTKGSLKLKDNGSFQASNHVIVLGADIDFEIIKAPLIVAVNNDAKFVTQADTQGYAGVSYSGFKFGEDVTSLNTINLTITRSNLGEEAADVYTDVLEASGITSQNYSISYQSGDYQIVAADQLYVKLADIEIIYGEEPVFSVESSGYYSSDNTQVVDLTSSTSVTGNKVTVVDGASGSAEFLIVPETPLYSTSNHLSVGTYNLVSDQAVFTSSNFNNTLIEQGVLRVNPKELVVSLSSTKSKVYDGNTSLPSMTFDLTTPFTGDKVSAVGTGIYESANAGETDYKVSSLILSGFDANNYYIQGGADFQITGTDGQISKRVLTVVPRVGQSKIFGTSDPILTYDYNGEVNGETPVFNGSLEREVGESRGLYAISQGSLLLTDKNTFLASNYELVFTSGVDFTITNKILSDQDISILPISDVIYNGQPQESEVQLKDDDTVLVEGVDYELSYYNNIDVGKAVITITGLGNYGGVRTITFNILPRTIIVTPDSGQSKEYGESDPVLTYTVSGEVSGETPDFSNSLSRIQGENVGIYLITQGSLILADNGNFKASNYEIDFASNIYFTITKAPLTITVNNNSRFVTQADVAGYAGVSYSGFKFGEDQTAIDTSNLSITRSNLGVNEVGVYPAVLEASGVISQNYDIVYQKGDYTIIGADQLLVKLKDSEVVYADVPVFEVLEAGYYNSSNELIEDLTSSVQVIGTEVTVTDGTSGTAVFDIVVVSPQLSSSGTLQSGSYVLESGNISKTSPNFSDTIILQGNLNVTPKELTVSLISSVTKEYDGNDNLLNLELSLTTPIDTDIVLASGAGVYESKDVGVRNYTVSGITLSGADAGNYFIQGGVNASITGTDGEITKRVLTVTPDANQGKTFGESDPSLTYSYSGLINGEIPLFSGTLGRDQGEDVGSYQITQGDIVSQDNGVFLKNNYELVFTERVFTISAKSIGLLDNIKSFSTISFAFIHDLLYSGLPQTPSPEVKDGSTVLIKDTDFVLTYKENINVGEATVTINGKGNYKDNRVLNFKIIPTPLIITAEDKTKEFGEDDPELTVSYTGFVNGEDAEDLTGTLAISRVAGESVGSYAITASGLTSTNYDITYTPGTFMINSRSITETDITVAPIADLVYNGSLQRPKPIVEDGSNLLEEGIDYKLSYSDNINVGQAMVTITGLGNYDGSRTVRFMIVPKVIEILIPDQEKDYGAQDPVLVFTADPVLFGSDEFTGVLSRESGEAVGEYLISSGTLSAGDNYTLNIQSDAIFRIIRIDSDGDGVADDIEETDGTDPLDTCDFVLASQTFPPSIAWDTADCDIDGVTNAEELIDGTDPLNSDSDGDGVVDGYEKTDGTDPLDFCSSVPSRITESLSDEFLFSDCDGDGLSNGDEIGLDPKNPIDSNGNGIFDYLEFNNYRPSAEDNLEVFNLLTPNGDGQNDVFVIRNIELYPENILEIYNRWGSKVYNVSGYGQNGNYFTGVSNGRGVISPSSLLPTGTYFYILKYKSSSGDFKERKGYLYLTR